MILAPEGFKSSRLYDIGMHVPSRIIHSRHCKSLSVWWTGNTDALMYLANERHADFCQVDLTELQKFHLEFL